MKFRKWKAQSFSDKAFDVINYTVLILIALICLYPLYYIVIISFSENVVGTYLWPNGFTLGGYEAVFKSKDIWMGYANTIFYTVTGVLFSLALTLPCAYALSRKDLVGRRLIVGYLTVTMFISGGMIPSYLVVRDLHLLDTRLIIIILTGCSVYNIVVARTFFTTTISGELFEAARMDGCGNTWFFLKIALPLSKPVIAVLALWIGVGRWNSYFTEMIYLRDDSKYPLALYLKRVLWQVNAMKELLMGIGSNGETVEISQSMIEQARLVSIMQYVIIVCATAPMLAVYPFIQKYFTKGVMVGSVKG